MNWPHTVQHTLHNRRAQLLLPAVLLLPLFVLVIYLLVETTKVSIAKVRHQFALDNAAYTQMTTVSLFLNAVGLLNGPLPYRVLVTYDTKLKQVEGRELPDYLKARQNNLTVYDLFFKAGAVPTIAPDYEWGHNDPPAPASTDWGVHYAQYENMAEEYNREGWEKETPASLGDEEVVVMNEDIVKTHYIASNQVALPAIKAYLNTYVQVGDTYNLQENLYKRLIKNAGIFREGYFLNVDDCRKDECARQSASRLVNYLSIPLKRQEADKLLVYVSSSEMAGAHGGSIPIHLTMTEMGASPLFFFAYVTPTGRSRLRTLRRGVSLKQEFPLPTNHFNINLDTKYKPYVRNQVILSCPRSNNNCVWPNPLPKYNVTLRP